MNRTDFTRPISFYLELHQQAVLSQVRVPGMVKDVVDQEATAAAIKDLAVDTVLPVNELLISLGESLKGFKVAIAVSGSTISMLAEHAPAAIDSFVKLYATGIVEWLVVPFHNSMSALVSGDVYREEMNHHMDTIHKHFGVHPVSALASPFFHPSMVELCKIMGLKALILKDEIPANTGRNYSGSGETSECTVLMAVNMTKPGFREDLLATGRELHESKSVLGGSYREFLDTSRRFVSTDPRRFLSETAAAGLLVWPSELSHHSGNPSAALGDLPEFIGNDMQKAALSALRDLEAMSCNIVDSRIRGMWLELLDGENFRQMDKAVSNRTNSQFLSAQDASNHLMDAIGKFREIALTAEKRSDDAVVKSVEADRQHNMPPTWAAQEQARYRDITH